MTAAPPTLLSPAASAKVISKPHSTLFVSKTANDEEALAGIQLLNKHANNKVDLANVKPATRNSSADYY